MRLRDTTQLALCLHEPFDLRCHAKIQLFDFVWDKCIKTETVGSKQSATLKFGAPGLSTLPALRTASECALSRNAVALHCARRVWYLPDLDSLVFIVRTYSVGFSHQGGSFRETIHGITRERIRLPGDIGGWLEGRSRFARLGLMIHVTSGFVAPGVNNCQVLEMSNVAGRPLAVHAGVRLCQIVLQRTEGSAIYAGRFVQQDRL